MKPNKQAKQQAEAWHPNFRIEETLPDTKVIRTSFLINGVAALVLVVAISLCVRNELAISEMRGHAEDARKEIVEKTAKFKQAQEQQKEFTVLEKKVREIDAFTKTNFNASSFVLHLGATLPRLVILDSVDIRNGVIQMHGTFIGASERATQLANGYLDQLKQDAQLAAIVQEIKLKSLERDQQGANQRLSFTIELKIKGTK